METGKRRALFLYKYAYTVNLQLGIEDGGKIFFGKDRKG